MLLTEPSLKLMWLPRETPSRSSTGLQSVVTLSASSQSAISPAFRMVALRASTWTSGLICLSLARLTSSVGPLSLPMRCISSATTRLMPVIHGLRCRSRLSHFSLVQMTMSYASSQGLLLSMSPVLTPTLIFRPLGFTRSV